MDVSTSDWLARALDESQLILGSKIVADATVPSVVWPAVTTAPADTTFTEIGSSSISELLLSLPCYSLLNGNLADIKPYPLTTVPKHHRWVAIGGLRSDLALKSMDIIIKAHWYHIETTAPVTLTAEQRRKTAIILGVTRTVMLAKYGLTSADFTNCEIANPPVNVVYGPAPGHVPSYTITVTAPAEGGTPAPYEKLTSELVLTEAETSILRCLYRCALALIPIQGYNLLSDDLPYHNTPDKASFRSFQEIERHLWVSDVAKTYLFGDKEFVRPILWHSAAHPVLPELKIKISSMLSVARDLQAAGVGSAAMRLPAVEPELRPISTYAKLTDAVKPLIEMYGGKVENAIFHQIEEALNVFPIGADSVTDNTGVAVTRTLGGIAPQDRAVTVRNRQELKNFAVSLLQRSVNQTAMCYGFFCRMTEEQNMIGGAVVSETLKRAYSLRKLKNAAPGSFYVGLEMADDYKAMAKLRGDGISAPPNKKF